MNEVKLSKTAKDYVGDVTSEVPLSENAIKRGLEMVKTKAGALELLRGAGILDKEGNLTEPYRPT